MDAQRIAVLAVVLVAGSACTHGGAGPSITPAGRFDEQVEGPQGAIYAQYSGGIVMRTVSVSFRVDRSAFVIVGHLGGDGVIRVLYPESPMSFGDLVDPVRARKTITTRPFFAGYDGAPSLYTFSMSPFRTMSARTASYDGLGHGFVFLIASSAPLQYQMIIDGDEWGEVPVRDYHRSADPRIAIHKYAEILARGNVTLKFANVYNTQAFTSYAATSADCSLLSSLGLNNLHGAWGTWGVVGLSSLGYGGSHYLTSWPGCGSRYSALRDYAFFIAPSRAYSTPPTLLNPTTPPLIPPTPTTRRPTYRPFGERAGSTGLGMQSRTIPTTRGSGIERGSRTGPSVPTSHDLRPSPSSYAPVHRRMDGEGSYGPRASGSPRTVNDAPVSRGRESSTPVSRPSPSPSSTPATKATTSTTTTATKHQ